jgi:hypothetical protein
MSSRAMRVNKYHPAAAMSLQPRVTGFKFPGLDADTLAFPYQLQSIVIRGNQAYLPNIAASPSDPLRFNVDTLAFVNIIDNVNSAHQTDASQSKFSGGIPNLNLGKTTLFFANPWGIAFTKQSGSGAGYAIAAASDFLVKVNIAADGTLSFTGGPTSTLFIDSNDPKDPATSGDNAGKNPQGIVITDDGKAAYRGKLCLTQYLDREFGHRQGEQGYPDNGLAGTGQQAGRVIGRRRDVLFLARPFQSATGHDDFGG